MPNLEKFEKLVKEMNQKFIEKDGSVTCEFATSTDNVLEKLKILADNMFERESVSGVWSRWPCETCKGYHEDRPLHVILIQGQSINDRKSKNKLFLMNSELQEVNAANESISKKIEDNVVISKQDFKEVVNIAMEKYKHEIIQNIPDSLIYFSEKADRMEL